MSNVLVLDCATNPVAVSPWQKVIMRLVERAAEVVEYYPDRYIHTPTALHFDNDPSRPRLPTCEPTENYWRVQMPSIIRLVRPTPYKKAIKFSRHNVYERDRGRCQYCGVFLSRKEFTYDHVIPRKQGGKTSWQNVVGSCGACNLQKGARTPEQAGMRLRSKPVKPKHLAVTTAPVNFAGGPKSWRDFLRDKIYWEGSLTEDE